MDINIRDHIINNFKGDDENVLREAIEESIKENDEITLPGMGVFFEIIWTDANEEMKNKIIEMLKNRVNRQEEKRFFLN